MPGARWLVALAFAGLLVVGCTQQEGGAVIGVPAKPDMSPTPSAALDTSAIEAGLVAQVAESTTVAAVPQGPLAPGQLPLDTFLTFKQQLRWASLETIGLAHIDQALAAIALVRYRVVSDGHVASWQRGTLIGNLDSAAAQLRQLRVTIAGDQLVYQTKADLSRVWKLHIDARVLTADREMLSAYDLGGLAALYASEMARMPTDILTAQSWSCDVTTAQDYVSRLVVQIQAMSYDSRAILAAAQAGSYKSAHGFQQAGLSARSAAKSDLDQAGAAIAYLKALSSGWTAFCP
jgi:hypothetical protein